jgi:hypothetical protein
MSIAISGSGGQADKGFFAFELKNPSAATVYRSQLYWSSQFTDTVTYTLLPTDQTGSWYGQITYNVPSKRFVKTTALTNVEAIVNP